MMTGDSDLEKLRSVRIASLMGTKDVSVKIFRRCPFHADKSPSFVLYPDNSFHCFGCGAHGRGAIDFVMKLGVSFNEAVEELKKYV